jgi:hypothetical protein
MSNRSCGSIQVATTRNVVPQTNSSLEYLQFANDQILKDSWHSTPNKVVTRAVAWTFYPRHGMIEPQAPPIFSGSAEELVTRAKAERWSFNPWPSVMLINIPWPAKTKTTAIKHEITRRRPKKHLILLICSLPTHNITPAMSSPICPMPLGEIVRDMLGKEKETNAVKKLYDDAFRADIGRWTASCAVIGLSAGIISKHPGHNLLAASAYNLAVVGFTRCMYL